MFQRTRVPVYRFVAGVRFSVIFFVINFILQAKNKINYYQYYYYLQEQHHFALKDWQFDMNNQTTD